MAYAGNYWRVGPLSLLLSGRTPNIQEEFGPEDNVTLEDCQSKCSMKSTCSYMWYGTDSECYLFPHPLGHMVPSSTDDGGDTDKGTAYVKTLAASNTTWICERNSEHSELAEASPCPAPPPTCYVPAISNTVCRGENLSTFVGKNVRRYD
jgi:hypothetical protein